MSVLSRIASELAELERRGNLRALRPRAGVDFCSNDYLGFAEDPQLQERILREAHARGLETGLSGSTGSRLLRGNTELHEELEGRLADFSGREAALYFPSGYQTNLALLSALIQPGDIVLSDSLNHASIIDGLRLSGARKRIYPHCDLAVLERILESEESGAGREGGERFIVTESVFSMEGDRAPLPELAVLAEKHGASLIVDDAHATGLERSLASESEPRILAIDERPRILAIDERPRILAIDERPRILAAMHSAGKALGTSGAWIACDAIVKDYLVNRARPFLFSTAPSPWAATALLCALEHWDEVAHERWRLLRRNCERFRSHGILADSSVEGPIFPVLIGKSEAAARIAGQLREAGFDVRAIRPPTVPEGKSRLRVTIRAGQREEEIDRFAAELSRALRSISKEVR